MLEWFRGDRVPPAVVEVADMFSAVQQQLGLKLESAKAPVEKLIIDSAQKPVEPK